MESPENLSDSSSTVERTAILVLGMHRSGTSTLARIINLHGAALASNLEPGDEFNEKGYWESKDLMAAHDRLLAAANSSWKDCSELPQSWLDSSLSEPFRAELKAILERDFSDTSLFLIKDPRICRLMPLWDQLLNEFNANPVFIIPFRNPAEVAQSLDKRDKLHQQRSLALWLRHVLDAEKNSRGKPRAFISFESLLEDWAAAIENIQNSLGIQLPLPSDKVYSEVESELSGNLKHFTTSKARIGRSQLSTLATRAFESLQQLENGTLENAAQTFDLIAEEFEPIAESLGPILVHQDQALDQMRQDLSAANEQVGQLEAHRDDLELVAQEQRRLAKAYAELEFKYHAGVTENERLSEEFQRLEADHTSLEREYSRQQDGYAHTLNEQSRLEGQLEQVETQINAIYTSTSWRISWPIRAAKHHVLEPGYIASRRILATSARIAWKILPLSNKWKASLKSKAFTRFPGLFGNTRAYRRWQGLPDGTLTPNQQKKNDARFIAQEPIYVPKSTAAPIKEPLAKLIAFYLPQFHSIPENDQWWGEGFTEWTNVKPAQPQFRGHYQPREPDELGYYNLREVETQRKQVALAKQYGVGGFCFYFYWFGGKRLLEDPLLQYLENPELDLPFCLCWANENWSRRWDGRDKEILIKQQHSPEDDLAFIEYVSKYLQDERYIRIDGKPLLVVYRPTLLPSIGATTRRWRRWCRDNGIGEIFLAYTQSFDRVDPHQFGFDAAIEFPPNNSTPPNVQKGIEPIQPDYSGTLYDWTYFADRSNSYEQPDYKLYRGVCPAWDNTARRKAHATVFVNSNPALYQHWLENAVNDTIARFPNPDHRLVFVNAWNEWAEGAYLEPDNGYGFSYLQATRNALESSATDESGDADRSILLVTHDAHPHGAQFLVLNMATQLKEMGCRVYILVLGEGELTQKYRRVGTTKTYLGNGHCPELIDYLEGLFQDKGVSAAIINSVASGHVAGAIKQVGFSSVGLVHELPKIIKDMKLEAAAKDLATYTNQLIFPANFVKESFEALIDEPFKTVISPQGLYKKNTLIGREAKDRCRQLLREQYGLAPGAKIVLGVGGGDLRKGLDLFVEIAEQVAAKDPQTYFIWAGKVLGDVKNQVDNLVTQSRHPNNIIITDCWVETDLFYAGADLYALTSREDPFPSVVLEAFDAAVPVIGFDGCGGFIDIVSDATGGLVPACDINAFAKKVMSLLADPKKIDAIGKHTKALVGGEYSFYRYAAAVAELAGIKQQKVSVILPNYNYAHLIAERISNISEQSYPIHELIILDDASEDGSQAIIQERINSLDIPTTLLLSDRNSGSVFKQWFKGVEQANGDIIWIAEADDLADPNFLATLVKQFDAHSNTVLTYCQSRQMSEEGSILAEDYLNYTNDISDDKWLTNYQNAGIAEIAEALSVKNTIPNVSAVLFDSSALKQTLSANSEALIKYKIAGDWFVYLRLLGLGNVAFVTQALNSHRRHSSSVTAELDALRHVTEVRQLQIIAHEAASPVGGSIQQAERYIEELLNYFSLDISLEELDTKETPKLFAENC